LKQIHDVIDELAQEAETVEEYRKRLHELFWSAKAIEYDLLDEYIYIHTEPITGPFEKRDDFYWFDEDAPEITLPKKSIAFTWRSVIIVL